MVEEQKLYQIDDTITALRRKFENMDDEFSQQTFKDTLDSLNELKAEKLDGLAGWSEALEVQNDGIAKRIKVLTAMKRRNTNIVNSLNNYMVDSLKKSDLKKMQTKHHLITTRKSRRVIVDDVKKLPKDFVETTTTTTPNKKLLRKALLAEDVPNGGTIDGAHLETNIKAVIK